MALLKKLQMCELRDLILRQVYVQRVKWIYDNDWWAGREPQTGENQKQKEQMEIQELKNTPSEKKNAVEFLQKRLLTAAKKGKFDDKSVEII